MNKHRHRIAAAIALSAVAALGLAACAPGGSGPSESTAGPISTDVAAAGDVTLTVWDQNTQEGLSDATDQLISEFEDKYPNVTIDRESKTFNDLKSTLRLALTSNTPPDVVQAGQGYPDMGAFVSAGLLLNLDPYAEAYKWKDRFPGELLDLNRFSKDGKTWHDGSLYGAVNGSQMVGIFYNKKILADLGIEAPTTFAELETAMAAAEAGGYSPFSFGDLDKSSGIHLFGTVLDGTADVEDVRSLIYSAGGAWTDDDVVKSAKTVESWVDKGYIAKDASGISPDAAIDTFAKGKTLFLVQGTWVLGSSIFTPDSKDTGFLVLKDKAGHTGTMGGTGLPWAVSSKSKAPDVAAAFVDWMTSEHASEVLIDHGQFPGVLPDSWTPDAGTLTADVAGAWAAVSKDNGLTPYLDFSTTTFYDTLANGMQELLTGQRDAAGFTQSLQDDYEAFQGSR